VELYNPSGVSMDLTGWALTDDPTGGTEPFVLDGGLLPPGGYALIWCDDGEGTEEGWHAPFKLSKDGETIHLLRPDGALSQELELPALDTEEAYVRLSDGSYDVIDAPTPGESNPSR
jgi:hypothetical protein